MEEDFSWSREAAKMLFKVIGVCIVWILSRSPDNLSAASLILDPSSF